MAATSKDGPELHPATVELAQGTNYGIITTVLPSGKLAISNGPVFNPDGERVGSFSSIWRREADGSWKIIFDKGCP